jgi:hypothetical protein
MVLKISEISYQGLTMEETRVNYPHIVTRLVDDWVEFERRHDPPAAWLNGQGLIHEEDFFSDVTSIELDYASANLKFTMAEIWAFKDPKLAMLFKLTWC